MTGGSSCPKVIRDWPLTEGQKQVAAKFTSGSPPTTKEQCVYEAAWEIELEYEALRVGRGPVEKREQRQHVRALRRRERNLVSAPRRAAAPSRMEIQRAALRYLRFCGGVANFNISAFVRYVQSKPPAERTYRSGKRRKLTDHAIRAILKQRLHIVGAPGRKRKKP